MARARLPILAAVDVLSRRAHGQPHGQHQGPTTPVVNRLVRLQRSAGNVVATAEAARIQAKLVVGAAADPAERQADEVAREVMQYISGHGHLAAEPEIDGREPGLQRTVTPAAPIGLDGGETSPELSASIQSERGRGHALPPSLLQPFEQAFGADLSGVRIHQDPKAAELNRAVSARAFTTGSDIFFGAGQYRPTSRAGQELLAHELTHTIQQR